jgi:dihydroorotate dehydrogenase (NAD+) catalytic subunit
LFSALIFKMAIIEKKLIGSKKVYPFTIPSGIITTEVSCLERMAREIPELGLLTTKSIGPQPRSGNREPILAQYIPQGFVNAVGLTNPGAEEFARKLSLAHFPKDKFLLASIFGKDVSEFVDVAGTLEEHVDGFELNLSCPHAKGYGMQLGQDKDVVGEITREVVRTTKKSVYAKLTPNAGNIGEIAKSAISAGAEGIVAINTVGPGYYSVNGNAVLTNKVGGLSGIGITPIGLKCVRDIRQAIGENVPIIGMGGIRNIADVEAYAEVGATFFGIGSALAGMNEREIKSYFSALRGDADSSGWTNNAEGLLKRVDMRYRKVRVERRVDSACDFKIIQTNENISAEPGQFLFAWIPNVGEKPFSIMEDNPLTFGILERGDFTRKINSLQQGDYFYVRGPYGQGVNVPQKSNVVLVGGGCGIAGLSLLAKRLSKESEVLTLLGGKDKEHIAYLDEFRKYGEVRIVTEDGSLGRRGLVTDLMNDLRDESYFFNCGPKLMVNAVLPLELKISAPERVYSSVDYMTRCGVGVCGSCADGNGRRTCVEGPFVNIE